VACQKIVGRLSSCFLLVKQFCQKWKNLGLKAAILIKLGGEKK